MPATAYVTRTELALADLTLVGDTYKLLAADFDAGDLVWRREMVGSPYVAGAVEVGAVKDQSQGRATVWVFGSSHAALQTNVDTLIDAFTQTAYTLVYSFDGAVWSWSCLRADIAVGFPTSMYKRVHVPVKLIFPRSPIPASGPF